jgi:hypothetical protein
MQQLNSAPNEMIGSSHYQVSSNSQSNQDRELKFSDYLGHLLFIATAFNWFLVFMLMQIHGNIYVTEVTPIREFEIIMTAVVCGFSFSWFFKKLKSEVK